MSRAQNRPERKRARRTPLGQRDILNFNGTRDPNKVYRVVNDIDGRIEDMRERGYELVQTDGALTQESISDQTQGKMCRKHVGQGVYGYLMAIDKEFYLEDQAEKQARVDRNEAALLPDDIAQSENYYGEGVSFGKSLEGGPAKPKVQHLTE